VTRSSDLQVTHLARLSSSILDIPPRTRFLIGLAAVTGIVLVTMQSFVGGGEEFLRADKLIHFTGYSLLSLLFVLALRPALFVPTLIGLVGMGLLIEFIQPRTGREFDLMDGLANGIGVAVGGGLGLLIRGLHAYIRTELATARAKKRLLSFGPGEEILRQGDPAKRLYIIQDGTVRVFRDENGSRVILGEFGPGRVIGLLGVVRGTPQYSTIEALTPTRLYGMSLDELLDAAGTRDHPVAMVVHALTESIHELAEKITRLESSSADPRGT
jgi:CRP-like cAMP-binding protein